jgi:uncharacterized membrane protein YeaQ/YmgE (transglycosylase-associated protein family)
MIFGLIVGIVAKLIFPGHDPGGIIMTMILGIVGAWLGGAIGRMLGMYGPGHPAGFFMAVVGAIVVLLIYHMAFGSDRSAGLMQPHATYAISLPAPAHTALAGGGRNA